MESTNHFTGKHWSIYHKYKKLWQKELMVALAGWQKHALSAPVMVTATVVVRGRRSLDAEDNLRHGLKPIWDYLTRPNYSNPRKIKMGIGVIWDDTPEWFSISSVEQVIDRNKLPMVKIELQRG